MLFEHLRSPNSASPTGLLGLRHRVHLTRDQLVAVLARASKPHDLSDLPDLQAVVDVRFRKVYTPLSARVSLSVWSHKPHSIHHAPAYAPEVAPPVDLSLCQAVFHRVSDAFYDWLVTDIGFKPETTRMLGTPFRSPVFWVAVPKFERNVDAASWLGARRLKILAKLAGPFLDAVDTGMSGVAAGAVGRDVVALRKLVQARDGGSVPTYALVPSRATITDTGADQEDRVRVVLRHLADLETDAAVRLWDMQSDLEIWDNHLDTYQRVVDRGSALWDALAGHLLQHRRRQLSRVHRSVELIHQTLLQGVADVDNVSTRVASSNEAMQEQVANLAATYDHNLGERPSPSRPGIRQMVLEQGQVAGASARARELAGKAERVARNYRDLIQAISEAFDERRVRESEVLEGATYVLGLVVALVGLVTVLDTTFNLPLEQGPPAAWMPDWARPLLTFGSLRGAAWFLGGLLLGAFVYGLVKMLTRGKLGSRPYRKTYRRVWEVLRHCATDHLAAVDRRLDPPNEDRSIDDLAGLAALSQRREHLHEERAKEWDKLDRRFATAYARAWDEVSGLKGDLRAVRDDDAAPRPDRLPVFVIKKRARADLRSLGRMIEKWSLRTFLVTERPLELHKADLPRMTILYRCALQLLEPKGSRIVSDMDFFWVFVHHGFTWEQVVRLHAWLDREMTALRAPGKPGVAGRVSAMHLLEAVNHLTWPSSEEDVGAIAAVDRRIGELAPVEPDHDAFAVDPQTTTPRTSSTPVFYSPRLDRWVVTGYAEARQVLADRAKFSLVETRRPLLPERGRETQRAHSLSTDDAAVRVRLRGHHERIMEEQSSRGVDELLDAVSHRIDAIASVGHADLVDVLATPPMAAVLAMAGVDTSHADDLRILAEGARRLHGVPMSQDDQTTAVGQWKELERKCRDISSVGGLEDCGNDAAEVLLQMVYSGPAATSALLGSAVHRLLTTGHWPELGDTASVRAYTDEALRHATPVVAWRREAARVVSIDGGWRPSEATGNVHTGSVVPEGARIVVDLGKANRDPAFYPDEPDAFRRRSSAPDHLSFGAGPHACPAQHLVREQVQQVLSLLWRRLPELDLSPATSGAVLWSDDISLRGLTSLLVVWNGGAAHRVANGASHT